MPVSSGPLNRDTDLRQRREVLKRTLRALPDPYLAALIEGLELHGDRLAPGRLYRNSSGRGCVVGALLRQLHPSDYEGPSILFWIRHGWRRRASSYRDDWAKNPRLWHLELIFDRAVARLQAMAPHLSPQQASAAIGEWFMTAAREESLSRRVERAFIAPAAEPMATEPADGLHR